MTRPRQIDDRATLRMDCRQGDRLFAVTLGGDRTLGNPPGLEAGETYTLIVTQDHTGGRLLSYGSVFLLGANPPVVDPTPDAVDVVEFLSPDGVRLVPMSATRLTGGGLVPLPIGPAATSGQAATLGQVTSAVAGGVGAAGATSGLIDDSGVAGFGPKQSDSNITINTRLLSGASAAAAAQTTANAALPKAGGTMTGSIVLGGDATSALHPTSKQQLDAEASARSAAVTTLTTAAAAAQTTANAALPKAGGTMTGALVLSGNAASPLHAVPKQQLLASANVDDSTEGGGLRTVAQGIDAHDGRFDLLEAAVPNKVSYTDLFQFANSTPTVAGASPRWPGDVFENRALTPYSIWDAGDPDAAHPNGNGWVGPRTTLAVGADGSLLGVAGGQEVWRTGSQARGDLGLVIGTNVEAQSAELDALAALDATAGLLVKTAANTYARRTLGATSGGKLAVVNGSGAAGTPTVGLATGTANTLLGYTGSGNPTEIAAGTNVTIVSGVISASGGGGTTSPEAAVASIAASYTSGGDTWYSADVLALSTMSLAADTPTYYLHFFPFGFTPTRIELEVSTLGALAVAKIGVYKLETDFSIGAQLCITGDLDCTSTGVKTATVTMSNWYGPGLYWVGVAASVAISIRGATAGNARLRLSRKSGGNGAAIALSRSLAYASALPSTAPALSSLALAANQPAITMGLP